MGHATHRVGDVVSNRNETAKKNKGDSMSVPVRNTLTVCLTHLQFLLSSLQNCSNSVSVHQDCK